MAKKSKPKTLNLRLEIIAKTPYAGSGPRGIDVYATHLYNELASTYSRDNTFLSRDKPSQHPVDLVHYTFFDPFFLTLWSRSYKSKFIVTVHDLIPLKFPAHFQVGIRGKLKWLLQRSALSRAAAVITDSECSKHDISLLAGISPEKIFVVPLAAGRTTVNEKMVRTVRKEYNLPDRYLLYVGDINWNKNVPGLIRAFGELSSETTHLVLVGKAFESSKGTPEYLVIDQAIKELAQKRSQQAANIHMLGFVPSHHLPAIYRGATLYVQPSWYEGFGFPLLEAMEQGVPVASSIAGSLKEVGGEYVHYFDPNVAGQMQSVLDSILTSKAKREKYLESGKVWAKSFSWERVIEETKVVYEKIVNHLS